MDLSNHTAAPDSFAVPPAPIPERGSTVQRALIGAALSVLLGLSSVLLLLKLLTGIPALLLGFISLRRLNGLVGARETSVPASLEWGRRGAIAGMALGGVGIVLGIIGLVSLILVRVGEASRRAACANNLRELGLAVARYHDHENRFPPATVASDAGLAGFTPWRAPAYAERLSWVVLLLPYLEEPEADRTTSNKGSGRRRRAGRVPEALRRGLDPNQPWDDPVNAAAGKTVLRQLLCPSHPTFDPDHPPAPTHYPGIAGIGLNAAELPRGAPNAGFFGYEREIHLRGPALGDELPAGASHTMMSAETMRHNGAWAAGGRSTVRPLDPSNLPYIGYDRQFGGMHPGGANLLMVGAEVRFFSDKGSPQVFESLATLWKHD
ncbi:MAG TPA: DUF1559 domain-containing protein [Gemmataceae bacterium]|nr:DUF1559 domain-containing protein [Gemmataceae bacterium]